MIRRLERTELPSAMGIIRAATLALENAGISQWDQVYPDESTVASDIDAGALFGYFTAEGLQGIIVLNELQSSEYSQIPWRDSKGKPLVVHRLCVHPRFQGHGIATLLMHYSEQFARQNQYTSIRLDAFRDNPAAVRLYDSLGYERLGVVTFRKGPFYCYERKLKESGPGSFA